MDVYILICLVFICLWANVTLVVCSVYDGQEGLHQVNDPNYLSPQAFFAMLTWFMTFAYILFFIAFHIHDK